jgi:hypothetical protein
MQRRHLLRVMTAFAVGTFIIAPMAAWSDEPSSSSAMGRMNHWAADQEALLNAKITGFKAGLKLTPDQEKLWAPFETAVRDVDKMHMDRMKSMMDRMQKMRSAMQQEKGKHELKEMSSPDEAVSLVDRLQGMAQQMSERGAAMMNVAEAAKPLYASLDDAQKRLFALLGGQLFMMSSGHPGMGVMRGMGMMGGDAADSSEEE